MRGLLSCPHIIGREPCTLTATHSTAAYIHAPFTSPIAHSCPPAPPPPCQEFSDEEDEDEDMEEEEDEPEEEEPEDSG